MIKSIHSTENNTSSPVLFTLVGQAALNTAYGHLVIPLKIPDLKKSFDELEDLEKAINQLTTGTDDMSSHCNSEAKYLKGKLNILHVISAGSLFQLAGFALSLFNKRELSNIKRAAESTESHQRYVAAKAEESLLRLSNLTAYTKGLYATVLEIASTQTDLYREIKRVGLETEIAQIKRIFVSEFTLFMTGIQSLIEGHFSPLW